MRSFIAFDLPENIIQSCMDLQNQWKKEGIGGRYTPRENIHLTIAFCGDLDDEQIEQIRDIFSTFCFEKIKCRTSSLVRFGNVVALGLEENQELISVVHALRNRLSQAGIPFDGRAFKAHITLLRKPVLPEHVSIFAGDSLLFELFRIVLYSSTLHSKGPHYTPLATVCAS